MSDSPTPGDSPVRSTTKTILLWVVLILVFAFVYVRESGGLHRVQRFGDQVLTPLAVLLGGLLLMALASSFRWSLRRGWDAVRWDVPALAAARLEDAGQLDEAASRWETLAQGAPRASAAWADFTLRQAWVALRLGRAQQAMHLLEPVLAHPEPRQRELAHALLALAMALRGHLPRTESLLNGLQDEGVLRGVVGGLASQVVLSRRGEYEEALALAVPPWDLADPLCRHQRQLWALLRAFALEHLPSTPERERDARRTLAQLRGLRPDEFDYFTEPWPELRAWLAERLAGAETPASPAEPSPSPAEPGPHAFASASFGLGLPARYDPVRPAGEDPRRTRLLLALLGGCAWLLYLNPQGASLGLRLALFAVLAVAAVLGIWVPWVLLGFGDRARDRKSREALHDLRLDDARHLQEALLTGLRGSHLAHSRRVQLLNLASLLVIRGERSLARRIFHALAHQPPQGSSPMLRATALNCLAEGDVLSGNSGRARLLDGLATVLWEGRQPTYWDATLLMGAVKAGDADEVTRIAEDLLARPGVPAHYKHRMMLFQAFTLEQMESPTREQLEECVRLQEQLRRQMRPGELDYLATDWPELRAFLDELGPTRAAA